MSASRVTPRSPPQWDEVRWLLDHWDGAATEIFVIDVPLSDLGRVLDVLLGLPDIEVLEVDNYILENPLVLSRDPGLRNTVQRDVEAGNQSYLLSGRDTKRSLQIFIGTGPDTAMIDIELVFWTKELFVGEVSMEGKILQFQWLIRLSEQLRGPAPSTRCLLCSEHNGDPRELLDQQSYAWAW